MTFMWAYFRNAKWGGTRSLVAACVLLHGWLLNTVQQNKAVRLHQYKLFPAQQQKGKIMQFNKLF